MRNWWRNFWDRFYNNEAYFVARVRALVMVFGLIGITEAKAIAENLLLPGAEGWLRRVGFLASGASLLLRAGDRTPKRVIEAADKFYGAP